MKISDTRPEFFDEHGEVLIELMSIYKDSDYNKVIVTSKMISKKLNLPLSTIECMFDRFWSYGILELTPFRMDGCRVYIINQDQVPMNLTRYNMRY